MVVPWDLVVHSIAFAVVLLLAITSGLAAIRSKRSDISKIARGSALYEDEDGIATEESQQKYSVRIQNILATGIVGTGFGVSLASAIRATAAGTNVITWWLQFGLWVCSREISEDDIS